MINAFEGTLAYLLLFNIGILFGITLIGLSARKRKNK